MSKDSDKVEELLHGERLDNVGIRLEDPGEVDKGHGRLRHSCGRGGMCTRSFELMESIYVKKDDRDRPGLLD